MKHSFPNHAQTGRQLSQIRAARGLTQEQMAQIAGISQAMVSQVEQGNRELPLRALERIVLKLGIDAASLVAAGNPATVLDFLSKAWDAYTQSRADYSEVVRDVLRRSNVLRSHWKVLRPFLRRLKGVSEQDMYVLDDFVGVKYREWIKGMIPPAQEEHTAYCELPGGALPQKQRLSAILELATIASNVTASDLDLLKAMATRLARGRTSSKNDSAQCLPNTIPGGERAQEVAT